MARKGTLFVVDDNKNILTSLQYLLAEYFERIITLSTPHGIKAAMLKDRADVILLDMNFSSGVNTGNEGLYWLRDIKANYPRTEVVLFTAYADIELAVTGIKDGAADFVVKPWDNAKLIQILTSVCRKSRADSAATPMPADSLLPDSMYWGESAVMSRLRQMVEKVGATDANVLITGENGTGKDMLAHELHRLSARRDKVMVAVDMGAVSESLFESELFGHTKGSFTDAHTDRTGRFEAADGGTLFLDEIANLPYHLQAKLLTVIQKKMFVKVGSNKSQPTDIRLICATNRNLEDMVRDRLFREDLFYRINTIHLHIPPLREHKEDILPLAKRFLDKYASRYGRSVSGFSEKAVAKLMEHPWYGNVRELQHVVEKAVILSDGRLLTDENILFAASSHEKRADSSMRGDTGDDPVQTIEEMERGLLEKALDKCGSNMSQAASMLGISRQTLYNKMKKYGL
ncbi:MAG: sigma-54 dependent transcriptional regulator [Bacteroides sp.]|nr:sigma-54 dependent transcriptional regulator [Roseburia sp.]MCM1345923.1 sigma-54 dependent transcriptional regulator [Bacteroides sp.]MCM1420088.1 sigma-54 dependent transcriptional regulator [Bacteroides sp.]